jgi:hypothetical protein
MHSLSVLRPAVWALVLGGTLSAAPVQWTAASGGNDNWYELISTGSIFQSIGFNDARAAATASTFNGMNGYLVTITSAAEYNFILNNLGTQILIGFGNTGSVWLGGSDAATPDTYRWLDGPEAGQAFTYTSWAPGHPNSAAGDHVALLRNVGSGSNVYGWFTNSGGAFGYIVEYGDGIVDAQGSAVPEPSSIALAGCGLAAVFAWRRKRADL